MHLGAPGNAGDKFGSLGDKSGSAGDKYGSVGDKSWCADDKVPTTTLGTPQMPVEQSGKNIFENAAGGPGNLSNYLSFNGC